MVIQSMKEMDEERKELQKKVLRLEEGRMVKVEEGKEKSKGNSNYTTINEQIYKDYFGGRKVKVNKGRHVIDKINEKSRKLSSNQKSGSNLHFVEGSIQINLSNNIVVSKKGSYDQHLTRKEAGSHNSSIRCTRATSRTHQDRQHEAPQPPRDRAQAQSENIEAQDIERVAGRQEGAPFQFCIELIVFFIIVIVESHVG